MPRLIADDETQMEAADGSVGRLGVKHSIGRSIARRFIQRR